MGYQLTWFNQPYLIARLSLWGVITLWAIVDNIIHRNDLPAGWQLHRVISGVLVIFIIQETATTIFGDSTDRFESNPTYDFLIFIYNVAESAFLGLLLLVSSGWKITRDTTKGRRALFAFPPIHCACSMIVDFILDRKVGHTDTELETAIIPNDFERTVLIVANLVSLVTLLYAWWWIFVCLGEERKKLRTKIEAQANGTYEDSDESEDDITEGIDSNNPETFARIDLNSDGDDVEEDVFDARTETGHLPSIPIDSTSEVASESDTIEVGSPSRPRGRRRRQRRRRQDQQLAQQLLPDAEPQNETVPNTADFGIPDRAKYRLMDQFSIMVQLYLFIFVLILMVNAWNEDRPPATIVVLDMCNVLIMAGLLYVFRLRTTNPYYILPETLDTAYSGEEYSGGAGANDYDPPQTSDFSVQDLSVPIDINDGNVQSPNDDEDNVNETVVPNNAFEIFGSEDDE